MYFSKMSNLIKFLLLILFVSSCGAGEFADPKLVAQNFLNDYVTMNYAQAEKYCNEDYKKVLEDFETQKALMDEKAIAETKSAKAIIKNVEIKEKEGVAYISFENSQLPQIIDELELQNIDGKWLITSLERKTDQLTSEKFTDEFIEELEKEAQEQKEILPVGEAGEEE